jgi:F-type H+-transporting ATPase subunit a
MNGISLIPETVFTIGTVRITDSVIHTWIVMAIITAICFISTRGLAMRPTPRQEIMEAVLESIENTIKGFLPIDPWMVVPVLGTFWIFIGFSNLAGLVPGLDTPTADLNTTFAFAIVSYSMTHVFGIKTRGLRGHLSHYAEPVWLLVPFHILAEATRTVALAVRLFGNMMSGEMIAVILLVVAGLFAPVPFSLLHMVLGLIQAYIFGVLTLVFIAGGIKTNQYEQGG